MFTTLEIGPNFAAATEVSAFAASRCRYVVNVPSQLVASRAVSNARLRSPFAGPSRPEEVCGEAHQGVEAQERPAGGRKGRSHVRGERGEARWFLYFQSASSLRLTRPSRKKLNAISLKFYSSLTSSSSRLAESALEILSRLSDNRSRRVSFLQTTFPPLHYGILTLLAASISSCFLLETDQEALAFLNAVQLKLLFTMLVGTFSSLAVVCVDLSDPFGGSYSIGSTVLQLFMLRDSFNENECRGDE